MIRFMETAHTCTVVTGADGSRCGKSAVTTFVGMSGDTYAECADHAVAVRKTSGFAVGDHVTVWRYGKDYDAVVSHIGARGAVYATFTYGNGAERTVRVED